MAKDKGTNLQASLDSGGYGVFYLWSLALPSGTIYRTTWHTDVTWNSQTWTATVCNAKRGVVRLNASVTAEVWLSGNDIPNQSIAFSDGVKGAQVEMFEAHDVTLGANDVIQHFKGVVSKVRTRSGWLVLECQQRFKIWPPYKFDKNTWGLELSKPGTYQVGDQTITLTHG